MKSRPKKYTVYSHQTALFETDDWELAEAYYEHCTDQERIYGLDMQLYVTAPLEGVCDVVGEAV